MKWVIQNNIYEEEGYPRLLETLDRLGLPKVLVKVVPFVGEIISVEGELPPDGSGSGMAGSDDVGAIVMGSYSLAKEARRRNWYPGAFLENLDFAVQRRHWGERMLNHDAAVYPFAEVPEQINPFFLRPVHDTKAFTGLVIDWPTYVEWRDGLLRIPELADPVNDPFGVNLLTAETPVMVCKKKEIYNETRTWIVDRKVVTASGYKVGTLKRYTDPSQVDARITDFAQECASDWSPNGAYVLDVAETAAGLKIVEVNNLNSAGWYRCDIQRLVQSLEDWLNDPSGLLW